MKPIDDKFVALGYFVSLNPDFSIFELFCRIREFLGPVFHDLAKEKNCKIFECHVLLDHVHMKIKIPPKYAVSSVIGYIKSKNAIAVARQFAGRKQNCSGEQFWARGYAISTVGFEEVHVRNYIRDQEDRDRRGENGTF